MHTSFLRLGCGPSLVLLFGLLFHTQASAQSDCKHSKQSQNTGVLKGGGGAAEWPVDILHQRISLDLTLANTIAGSCEIKATPRSAGLSSIPLQLLALTVDSVTSTSGSLAFERSGEDLVVQWGTALTLADTVTFTVYYRGTPATDASGFGGLVLGNPYTYNLGVAFTSVPHSFGRSWFPCVDNFMERSTYEFIIRSNNGKNAWCNGELISEQMEGGDMIRHWRMDDSMPAYLAAVAAAPYTALHDTFPSVAGTEVPVVLVALPADTSKLRSSFIHLPIAFSCYEDWFGPFRWNKVGYVLTPTGAMEHSTSIHFPRTIVDGTLFPEDIMVHELGHEWFGNLVTCERAEEMYINEGFAEYLSYLFLECAYGPQRYKNTMRSNHRKMVHRAHLMDQGWWALADMPQEWTYGEHTYNKAAGVIHSMRHYLGDYNFRSGLSSFLDQHAFQAVNSIQLRNHLSQASGVDMSDFFDDWIFQPGYAAFEVDSFSTAASAGSFQNTVHVQQKMRGPAQFYNNVPVSVSCMAADGSLWQAPASANMGGGISSFVIGSPFEPIAILLNVDESLNLAMTYDRDTLTAPGTKTYTTTDIRLTVNSLPGPIPIHIQQYWVAADGEVEENFAYVVSPDRWWRIAAAIPDDASISGRIQYDGRNTSSALDPELMQSLPGMPFREDSLVLLYRPDQRSMWQPHPDFTVNVLGNATDKLGRIDFNAVRAGEYTLAWRKSAVGIADNNSAVDKEWAVHPNPASHHLSVQWKGAGTLNGALQLWDQQGRTVLEQAARNTTESVDLSAVPMGTYHLRYVPLHGQPHSIEQVVIVR